VFRARSVRTREFVIILALACVLPACAHSATTSSSGGSGGQPAGGLGTRQISGIGTVLDDSKGRTLYHNTEETSGKIVCTGNCEQAWPPLSATSGQAPPASAGLASDLGVIQRPDGSMQVTFKGMPLYTYSGDSEAGQATGQGVGGVWFAVTSSGSAAASPSPGGGYGY
jgi:predicted lipoprotein with Yx(FWY)xxD motif